MYLPVNLLEVIAVIVGVINIYLAARANIWNWFFGIITVSLYFVIFINAKLYADAALQLVYLYFQFYGLYRWRHQSQPSFSVSHIPNHAYLTSLIAFIITDVTLYYFLKNYTDSTTVMLDSLSTSISLIAQWMMIRKWLESWYFWTLANAIAIEMYFTKSLYFTCGLYAVFIFFNCYGYCFWKKIINKSKNNLIAIPVN